MLESEFKRQRANLILELAGQTTDPFIRKRLLALVSRYDVPARDHSVCRSRNEERCYPIRIVTHHLHKI